MLALISIDCTCLLIIIYFPICINKSASFVLLHLFTVVFRYELVILRCSLLVVVNGFQYFYHDPFSRLFFLFLILREEEITSIIRKSIETQWSFTQSLPIFLFRLNAWFFGLPCQTTSKEIYHCGIIVFCTGHHRLYTCRNIKAVCREVILNCW